MSVSHFAHVAPPRARQATCAECPWRRAAAPGWLGTVAPEEWVRIAHSDCTVPCHTASDTRECAGLAIYRANVCKLPRDPHALRLPTDRVKVFASAAEFIAHHRSGVTSSDASQPARLTAREEWAARRGMPSAEQLATRPHGTRTRYRGGCRCVACRAANSRYAVERDRARRRGETAHLVDAEIARSHLAMLSRKGVGSHSVAEATGVARTVIVEVRSGRKTRIRATTERRILAIDSGARAGGATVPAGPTWRLIRELLEEGFTKGRIALELGNKVPALQIRKRRILLSTAVAVEKLYRRYVEVPA